MSGNCSRLITGTQDMFRFTLFINFRAADNRGIEDTKIFFLITQQKHTCDPSLEPSGQEGFYEGSQPVFFIEKCGKLSLNYPCYPFLSGALIIPDKRII